MKQIVYIILFAVLLACTPASDESVAFGMNYNSVRKEFGSPTIKQNMKITPGTATGEWTLYAVDQNSITTQSYHNSKIIRMVVEGNVMNEEDIFINTIGDTTFQLNVETVYSWMDRSIKMHGNVGVMGSDRWMVLSGMQEIDSVLNSWGLSRLDE